LTYSPINKVKYTKGGIMFRFEDEEEETPATEEEPAAE